MIAVWANIILIHTADAAIKARKTVHSQNIKLYDNDNDSDDTDKKYVDSDSCNLLDVLAALMKMWDKLQSNMKDKNKKVTQKQIKKKSNILYLKFFIKKSILTYYNKKAQHNKIQYMIKLLRIHLHLLKLKLKMIWNH